MSDSPSPITIRTIHRSDYQPPDWLVETVHLEFDLSLTETEVSATLTIRRNGEHDRPLRLDEDGAIPEVIRIDGKAVNLSLIHI